MGDLRVRYRKKKGVQRAILLREAECDAGRWKDIFFIHAIINPSASHPPIPCRSIRPLTTHTLNSPSKPLIHPPKLSFIYPFTDRLTLPQPNTQPSTVLPSIHLSIYRLIHKSTIRVSTHLTIKPPSKYMPIICPPTFLPFHQPSTHPSIHPVIHRPIHPCSISCMQDPALGTENAETIGLGPFP